MKYIEETLSDIDGMKIQEVIDYLNSIIGNYPEDSELFISVDTCAEYGDTYSEAHLKIEYQREQTQEELDKESVDMRKRSLFAELYINHQDFKLFGVYSDIIKIYKEKLLNKRLNDVLEEALHKWKLTEEELWD